MLHPRFLSGAIILPSMRFTGKTALVTGSSRNLGRDIVLALAREGAYVISHGFQDVAGASETARLAAEAGVRSSTVIGDVGDAKAVAAMVKQATRDVGPIDILITCAGTRPHDDPLTITSEQWRRVMATNLDGAFFSAQAVLPGMIERGFGRIVLVAGDGLFGGPTGQPHVMASKSGLLGLTKALAKEYASHGILVNCVSPGTLHTGDSPYREPYRDYEQLAAHTPTGKVTALEDATQMCLYLCAPEQTGITGQTISINSGTQMR
jgi:3-oxoacyl-[acyl-carrier protein] reductase